MLWKAESVIMVLARLDSSEPRPLALRRVHPLMLSSCLPPPYVVSVSQPLLFRTLVTMDERHTSDLISTQSPL